MSCGRFTSSLLATGAILAVGAGTSAVAEPPTACIPEAKPHCTDTRLKVGPVRVEGRTIRYLLSKDAAFVKVRIRWRERVNRKLALAYGEFIAPHREGRNHMRLPGYLLRSRPASGRYHVVVRATGVSGYTTRGYAAFDVTGTAG